jgi:hypothetical protein
MYSDTKIPKKKKPRKLKFGDIVLNGWASKNNPNRLVLFVRYFGQGDSKVYCLSRDGKDVIFQNDNDLKLSHIFSMQDFDIWSELLQ